LVIDYTDKSAQKQAMATRQPWLIAKGQNNFLFVGDTFVPASRIADPHNVWLELKINGETK
jgi:acylpyruvate hydrolase